MGVVANVGYNKFPKQGEFKGKRAEICFNYDIKNLLTGTIVRDDVEEPFRTIIHLDDGRYIESSECQYSLLQKGK